MRALQGCLHALSHGHLGAILELLRERMGTIRKDKDERLFVPFQHAVGGLAFGVEDEGTQPRVRVLESCWHVVRLGMRAKLDGMPLFFRVRVVDLGLVN